MSQLFSSWPYYWNFSFSISPSNDFSGFISLGLTGWIFLLSKELSEVFSSTTIQKYQFFGTQPSLWSNFLIRYWKNHSFDYTDLCQQSDRQNFWVETPLEESHVPSLTTGKYFFAC